MAPELLAAAAIVAVALLFPEALRSVHRRIDDRLRDYLRHASIGGFLLFAAALLALVFANTDGLAEWRRGWLGAELGVVAGDAGLVMPAGHWINDGLMAFFFLLVGLGIKRELAEGELSHRSKVLLPVAAAVGGMAVPALIYAALNRGDEAAMRGWAVPMATDVAFTLGVLALLGARIPHGLKVFLTTVAVVDDLLAIAVIALFHTAGIDTAALARGAALLGVLFLMNRMRVENVPAYLLVGVALWFAVLESGIHATLAGVALAMAIPVRPGGRHPAPLPHMMRNLLPPVTFVVLPVFAFANAGVDFRNLPLGSIADPIPLGIALGLVLGKTAGIFGASYVLVRPGIARLPAGCTWGMILAVSLLCGIGFTVSLFIGNLAFGIGEERTELAKLGVLAGGVVSGVAGYVALLFAARPAWSGPA